MRMDPAGVVTREDSSMETEALAATERSPVLRAAAVTERELSVSVLGGRAGGRGGRYRNLPGNLDYPQRQSVAR